MNTYTFSLNGFDDLSCQIMPAQLDVIRPYLSSNWVLCNDDQSVDLRIGIEGRSKAPNDDALNIMLTNELRFLSQGEFELPLRVFTLLDLLNYADSRLSAEPEVGLVSMAEWIVGLAQEVSGSLYVHNNTQTFICAQDKVLRTNASDKTELVELIFNSDDADWKKSEDVSILKPSLELPIASLLWSLGLKEHRYAAQKWNRPDALYRLLSWPQLGHWESTAPMFRLSSLYGRKAATVKTGMMVSGLNAEEVCTFLHACSVSGLRVKVENEEADTVTQPPIDASLSVLQAFKAKLGL